MQEMGDVTKPVSLYSAGNGFIMEVAVHPSVIVKLWHMDQTHQNVEANVSLDLIEGDGAPLLKFVRVHHLSGISVHFSYNVL